MPTFKLQFERLVPELVEMSREFDTQEDADDYADKLRDNPYQLYAECGNSHQSPDEDWRVVSVESEKVLKTYEITMSRKVTEILSFKKEFYSAEEVEDWVSGRTERALERLGIVERGDESDFKFDNAEELY